MGKYISKIEMTFRMDVKYLTQKMILEFNYEENSKFFNNRIETKSVK